MYIQRKFENRLSSTRKHRDISRVSVSDLFMAETPISPEPIIDESLREEDPIEFIAQEVKVMDVNAIIK